MDSNEKELNGFNSEEVTEEITSEVTEEKTAEDSITKDTSDEIVEQSVTDALDEDENVDEAAEENADEEYASETTEELSDAETVVNENVEVSEDSEIPQETEKKKSTGPIVALIIVIAAAIIIIATLLFSDSFGGNKYNKMGYVNVSGRTVQDIADAAGIELKDFLSEYNLPEDMPGDTTEIAAIYCMPAKIYLQTMIGIDDFEVFKTELNIPDETTPNVPKTFMDKIKSVFVKDKIQTIDENTPWYIVEGEITVNDYSGGAVEEFKEYYGLGDDVTGETRMKEIQDRLNEKTKELLVEQEAAQNSEAEAEDGSEEEADGSDAESKPADDASAEAESVEEAAE